MRESWPLGTWGVHPITHIAGVVLPVASSAHVPELENADATCLGSGPPIGRSVTNDRSVTPREARAVSHCLGPVAVEARLRNPLARAVPR